MDLLDRLLGHDAWTTTQILQRCREVTPEQFQQPFDVGYGSIVGTLDHMIGNVETWTALMDGTINEHTHTHGARELEALITRHEASYARFAALARQIRDTDKVNALWTDVLDKPPTQKSFGSAILHVITHNMHHRGELLHMLARLGLKDLPEGDLLGWEMQHG